MRLGLILGEAGSGLRRNISMVVSVVLVTFISLTFVGASILLQMQIGQMKNYWNDRAQVIVYLCTEIDTTGNCTLAEATEDQIAAVKQQLDSATLAPYINEIQFENHEQAFANFQEQFADTAFDGIITPQSLPENFRVNLVDPEQADVLIESLSGLAGVEGVEDQRAYLEPIFAILNAASFTAIGVAGLMLVAAVLLIATTIRLSAFSRRRELGIMRLVGASNRFIQTPFILEGVFASLIGSALAAGTIVAIVHFFVSGYLADTLPLGTSLLGMQEALLVVPILIAVGAGLAAISAGVAITRYLKV
ncbi:permease-like cell division protein FtsX [Salinibacterium sp. M195]|uniref:permease-like cell division protein FtsX n=1 Tax=Salinibacterium sp. M195 TaxID=2583374 RepID=UPI001C63079B|nr:permease-like cell division protein FtsX [Salinibacterium sp. M195]QYH36636.1 ABC transporter permease [Salinibacterium sp. M195]